MKKIYSILILSLLTIFSYGQFQYIIDFDSPWSENNHIIIDTISNPNNLWQIGVPNKPVFDSAYSITHALVTDTLNSYPINDTSSFILKHIRQGELGGNESLQLNFWFKMNTDSLSDYGKVEASIDNGITWVNLMTEDTTYYLQWIEPKPVLTGNSNGWQHFALELNMLTYELGYSDTLLYRFTFISDSIQTNKDGWMIDDFLLADWWEGIEDNNSKESLLMYPNPTSGIIYINEENFARDNHISIINNIGQVVFETTLNEKQNLDIRSLQNGVYVIIYEVEGNRQTDKIILSK
jgi:hypothetical protein